MHNVYLTFLILGFYENLWHLYEGLIYVFGLHTLLMVLQTATSLCGHLCSADSVQWQDLRHLLNSDIFLFPVVTFFASQNSSCVTAVLCFIALFRRCDRPRCSHSLSRVLFGWIVLFVTAIRTGSPEIDIITRMIRRSVGCAWILKLLRKNFALLLFVTVECDYCHNAKEGWCLRASDQCLLAEQLEAFQVLR